MIFVTLGSQKFQFNRLLKKIDELVADMTIDEEIFAQIGYSSYKPINYKFKEFLDRREFAKTIERCQTVITHGGTGTIIGAIKKSKKVVAVPRLAKYGEHVDDHQIQIIKQFQIMGIICACYDIKDLEESLKQVDSHNYRSYESNSLAIMQSIERFIEKI